MNKRESANLRKFQLLASDVVSVFDLLLRYQSPMISLSVKSKGKTKNNIKTFSSISISFSDLLTLQIAILLLIFGSYLHTLFSILAFEFRSKVLPILEDLRLSKMIEQFINFIIRPPSSRIPEAIHCSVVIIYLLLCLKIFLFLVLYIATEIVDVGQMPMKLLLFFFHQILLFLLLTSQGQACLMENMLALVGMNLLYGAEDPSIAGMVLDSAFSNLYDLMMELADVYKIRLPKFTVHILSLLHSLCVCAHVVKMAVQYMRRVIEKKAKFDIMDLNCLLVAPKTFIPVLLGHGNDDQFIQPHHSDLISESYAGDKNIIKFDGDHNSSRPQFFYNSISIFFYNVLHPPHTPRVCKLEKYFDFGDLKTGSAVNESATTDAASSSSAPPNTSNSITASVSELISKVAPVTAAESMIREEPKHGNNEPGHDEPADMKDEQNDPTEDYFSYCSSTRESWGRCSTLVLSDEESYPDFRDDDNGSEVFATPLGSMREMAADPKEEGKDQKKKKKAERSSKKLKSERFDKWESLSQRLRLCILKGRPKPS
ncbi:hypothetical protein HKD37_15G042451 [Glycine soja]